MVTIRFKILTLFFVTTVVLVLLVILYQVDLSPVIIGIFLVLITVFLLLLDYWIFKPLRIIRNSLNHSDPVILDNILPGNKEFFAIAQMLQQTYKVKRKLENEISERRKVETMIQDYARKLEESGRSKDKFFSILAHDLKSPFHALLGFSEIIRHDYDQLNPEERKKFIEIIYSSSKQVSDLLDNLLQWSRLQTNRVPFDPEVFDISRETDFVRNYFEGAAIKKSIRILNYIPEGTMVFSDKLMVRSILHNLVSNAVKFSLTGGEVRIEAFLLESGFLEINVSDNGIGITETDISRLFRIDVQFTRKGTHDETGTGLGLILCKELTEKNGGTIRATSTAGKGSSFIFTLPVRKPEPDEPVMLLQP